MKGTKRVTIKDIASKLGLSSSTVSRALNDHPYVKDELRERIKAAAKEMGYIPFKAAKALKTTKTMTIGIIVSDIKNPFFLDFLDGAESVLFPRKYKILLCNSDEDGNKEREHIKALIEHGVDGIIISPTFSTDGSSNAKMLLDIKKMGIPVVLYDRVFENYIENFDSVTIDNRGAIVEAIKYLYNLGHRKVGIVLADMSIYTIKERFEGYKEGCDLFKLQCSENHVLELSHPIDRSGRKLEEFLKRTDITALIATNHMITKIIYRYSKMFEMRIPSDMSIIGFDDVEENEFFSPPVTVISQPVFQIGQVAATLLLNRIDGGDRKPVNIVFKTSLVERDSVGMPN